MSFHGVRLLACLLFISISQSSASADLQTLESALDVLFQWFSLNCLALNPYKSDAILLGTRQRNSSLSNISHISMLIAGPMVPVWNSKTPRCYFRQVTFTFHKSVKQVSQSCHYHMKALRHIIIVLAIKLPHSSLMPSSVLVSTTSTLFSSVHPIMSSINFSAFRILSLELSSSLIAYGPLGASSSTAPLATCPKQISFKLATIRNKALFTNSPQYFASLIHYQVSK